MNEALRYGIALCMGGLYGVVVSWIVNCTLVEISINTFFAVVSPSITADPVSEEVAFAC